MEGNDRVRFCRDCKKSVFNLTDMTAAEASALVDDVERRPCVTYFERADGTVLTADCPVGVSAARRRMASAVAAAGALAAGLLVGSLAPGHSPRGKLLARCITSPADALLLHGGATGVLRALWTGESPSLDAPPEVRKPGQRGVTNKGFALRPDGRLGPPPNPDR